MRLFHPTTRPLRLFEIALPLLVLVPLGLLVTFLEPDLFLTINQACAIFPDTVWVGLSLLGNGWVIAALLLPFTARFPQLFFASLMTAPWTAFVAKGTKFVFSTPRPPAVLEAGTFQLLGEAHLASSMPSGHTLTAFAVATVLARVSGSPFAGHARTLYVIAALVGLSRIGMGVHWPEDVLIGAAIGWLCGLLATDLAERWFPARWLAMPQSGFRNVTGNGARAAFMWSMIGLLPAIALYTLDEDRGLAPELRFALATLALVCSLWMLWQSWQRYQKR